MKKLVPIAVVAVAAVAIVLAVLLVNNNKKTDMNMTADSKSTSTSSPQTAQSTNSVSIADFAFSPASITVKKGTTVTWTNNDSAPHTVTENDDQAGPNSPTLDKGKSYSFTFDTAGTFKYHCAIHSTMTGTVTVTE